MFFLAAPWASDQAIHELHFKNQVCALAAGRRSSATAHTSCFMRQSIMFAGKLPRHQEQVYHASGASLVMLWIDYSSRRSPS